MHRQADLDRLEKWADLNRMRFNKDKYKVLHLGRGNQHYGYRLGAAPLSSTEAERHLGVRIDARMNMSHQCNEAIDRSNRTLSYINRGITNRSREVLLCVALVRLQLESCVQSWVLHFKRDVENLERVQRRPLA